MKTCECSAVIDRDVILTINHSSFRCCKCGCIYNANILAQYIGDEIGDHGELAHRYFCLGNRCPDCGADMFSHRMWHDLMHGESIEALETIMLESGLK